MGKVIIGFDGLHRSGKDTQINLLQRNLNLLKIPSVVARGDGTRRGTNSQVFDYPSRWWRDHWDYFQDHEDASKELEKMNLKFQRLNREAKLYFSRNLERMMRDLSSSSGIMIMDRTLPSRYLTMRSIIPSISFEESIKSYNPSTGKPIMPIVPYITFILHAPKEVLISRLEDSTSIGHDFNFKYNIIEKYYSSFVEVINELSNVTGYCILDATQNSESISKNVLDKVLEAISNG